MRDNNLINKHLHKKEKKKKYIYFERLSFKNIIYFKLIRNGYEHISIFFTGLEITIF